MDTPTMDSPDSATGEETSAQRQARIRREKREKKILQGGSARLERITQVSGRPAEPASERPQGPPTAHDPEEVDISNHPYTSRGTPSPRPIQGNPPTQADIRTLLRGQGPVPDAWDNSVGMPGQHQGAGVDQEPMMRLLQQMMGMPLPDSGGQGTSGPGADGGLPPGLATLLGGGAGGPPGQQQSHFTSSNIWRILHTIFAFSLGAYVVATLPFSGSRMDRVAFLPAEGDQMPIFWVFATAELIMQSTRFFLEREKQAQGGILGTVAGFLPSPWRDYLLLVARYSGIYTTVVEDAMVIIFTLGAVAWWKGAMP